MTFNMFFLVAGSRGVCLRAKSIEYDTETSAAHGHSREKGMLLTYVYYTANMHLLCGSKNMRVNDLDLSKIALYNTDITNTISFFKKSPGQ